MVLALEYVRRSKGQRAGAKAQRCPAVRGRRAGVRMLWPIVAWWRRHSMVDPPVIPFSDNSIIIANNDPTC